MTTSTTAQKTTSTTAQMTTSTTDQTTTPEPNTAPQRLQDDILDTIEANSIQPSSSPEPFNRATNTALQANEISAKPSADLILKGSKRIRRQAHASVLANLFTLFGYYTDFVT